MCWNISPTLHHNFVDIVNGSQYCYIRCMPVIVRVNVQLGIPEKGCAIKSWLPVGCLTVYSYTLLTRFGSDTPLDTLADQITYNPKVH